MLIRVSNAIFNTDFVAGAVIGTGDDEGVVRIVFSCPVPVAPNQMCNVMDFTGEAAARLRRWLGNRRNVETLGPTAACQLCGKSDQENTPAPRAAKRRSAAKRIA